MDPRHQQISYPTHGQPSYLHPQTYTVTPMGLPPQHSQQSVMMPTMNHYPSMTAASTSVAAVSDPTTASSSEPRPGKGKGKKKLTKEEKKKKKKLTRVAGGQTWEDPTLEEWDPKDFRIFCGDLGNDVTDDVLTRAFNRYLSFLKAKVIRDTKTNKSKGYGFVSFKDPEDFIRAMRDMNGKYVGSRPIKLRKSNWKDRNLDAVKKKQKERAKMGLL